MRRTSYSHGDAWRHRISWRTLGTIDTFAISWFMTGAVHIAGSIAVLEITTMTGWYYLHERVWSVVAWGRQ